MNNLNCNIILVIDNLVWNLLKFNLRDKKSAFLGLFCLGF